MTEPDSAPAQTPVALPPSGVSSISKRWKLKMIIIAIIALAFGVYGYYDAAIAYPARGVRAAEFLEYQYLDQLHRSGAALAGIGIDEPKDRLARLREQERIAGQLNQVDHALEAWLGQLEILGRLKPEYTGIPRTTPQGEKVDTAFDRHALLKSNWDTAAAGNSAPSPLSWYDLPLQWAFMAIGLGVGAWMLALIARVRMKRYKFDNTELRLTLPGGESLVPADIEDFDKRKWHRLFVTLKVKPSHPQLGGKEVELDLLRYEPVEEWILAMERVAFPDRAEKPAEDPSDEQSAATT